MTAPDGPVTPDSDAPLYDQLLSEGFPNPLDADERPAQRSDDNDVGPQR